MTTNNQNQTTPAPKPKKAINPDRLKKLMDFPATYNNSRVVFPAETRRATLVRSWGGELSDLRPFEKLQPPLTAHETQDYRGSRVASLPSNALPSNNLIIRNKQTQEGAIDSTTGIILAPQKTKVESYATPMEIEYLPVPKSIFLQEGIMSAKERRERLEFETKYHDARAEIQKAELKERRLHHLIHSRHVTNGIFDEQSSSSSSQRVRGLPFNPTLLSHDTSIRDQLAKENRIFTHKAPASTSIPLNTQQRLFNQTPYKWNPDRAQYLRNEGEAGRAYNIVSNNMIAYVPPSIPEKQHARQAHPSIIQHPYSR